MGDQGRAIDLRVVAIGEILWDLLPSGKQMGGAPANFACHARALGAQTWLISRVGDDAPGFEILGRLPRHGLSTDTITVDAEAPTGTVTVELGADGQPKFTIHENVAWDRIEASSKALDEATLAGAICFGSLAQRCITSQRAIRETVSATRPEAFRIFDVNLRPPYFDREIIEASLELANVLKLNDQELPLVSEMFDLHGGLRKRVEAVAHRFGLRVVALTRGADGSLLFRDGDWSDHPGAPCEVCDTVGAGDAFAAVLAVGIVRGWPADEINERANRVAAFVCSQPGATPPLPNVLIPP